MSVPAVAIPTTPGRARYAIRAIDGCAITIDGREVLRVGARPVYRADVDSSTRCEERGCRACSSSDSPCWSSTE